MSVVDWCRHCLTEAVMTLEHLPPRSAGNDQPIRVFNETGQPRLIREFLDGHAIPRLCDKCNGGASNRNLPAAYKLWRNEVIGAVRSATSKHSQVRAFSIWRTDLVVDIGHSYALHPGRIVRQVLGMVLAVQDDRELADHYPQLRDAYFSEVAASIEPLTLHVALANTNLSYFTDVVMYLQTDHRTGESRVTPLRLWSFTPFVAVLVEGDTPPWRALRIDQWLQHPTDYCFRKHDRRVGYPIADRSDTIIAKLYEAGSY